jgi:ferredoxin/nitrate reductase gamma subunit
MTITVDPNLLPQLQRYGAFDVAACFNCGNCTAVCPLTGDDATFPRRIIRYAQVGMKEELLSSKELWTCYYCGECSETCPRQAEPGEFMAAARRYAIATYDRTRLARTMYLQPLVGTAIAVLLAVLFALFMYAGHGPQDTASLARYRIDCEAVQQPVAWYRRRWLLHALTMWGFLGLLAATIADYGLDLLGIKATGTPVPLWYPVRLLGTVAGLMLVFGTTMLILGRLQRTSRSVRKSGSADWTLLTLLWLTGVTGFVLEVALYLPQAPSWGYWVFLFHVAVAMELVLLAPFMKLAHVVYRPVALFFYAFKPAGTGQ